MATIPLSFSSVTNSLGTTVSLSSVDGKFNAIIDEHLERDPLRNLSSNVISGYFFRSPAIHNSDWAATLQTLENIDGEYSITAELSRKKDKPDVVTGYARFENQNDAAVFAWMNVAIWQKWSDDNEAAAQKAAKARPKKFKINADGTVSIKVTSTKLGA